MTCGGDGDFNMVSFVCFMLHLALTGIFGFNLHHTIPMEHNILPQNTINYDFISTPVYSCSIRHVSKVHQSKGMSIHQPSSSAACH